MRRTIKLPDSPADITAADYCRLSRAAQLELKDAAVDYWRTRGFPFDESSPGHRRNLYNQFVRSTRPVFAADRKITYSPVGLGLANSFHPHMWSVKCQYFRSPMQVFEDDTMFRDCIDKALRISTYRLPLCAGSMRSMLRTYSNTKRVSNFRPTVARALYKRYSPNGGSIVDPSAGFGGRLLGALPLNRTYCGIEPAAKTVKGLRKMVRELRNASPGSVIEVRRGRAETLLEDIPTGSVHLVINSPPYFSREEYADDTAQSFVRYPSYQEWLEGFLDVQFAEAFRMLRRGGFYCLNVANTETVTLADDAYRMACRYFRYHYRYRLMIGNVPYHRNGQKGAFRSEPLFVFRKR